MTVVNVSAMAAFILLADILGCLVAVDKVVDPWVKEAWYDERANKE